MRPPAPASGRAAPPWRQLLRTRGLCALLAIELLVALAVVLGLWALRRQTLDGELRGLAALSAAMAAQADATLDVAGAALRATGDELAAGTLRPGSDDSDALLRARAEALPEFRALSAFDADGLRVASSCEQPAPAHTVAQREFFVAARGSRQPTLFVGDPCRSRADSGSVIGVSLAVHDGAGAFRGVVALAADPGFIKSDFARIAPDRDIGLAIVSRDLGLVSSSADAVAADLLPSNVMARLWADARPERALLETLPDGRQRLLAAHPLRRWPLMMVASRDAQAALADWTEQAWIVGAFASSVLLVALSLGLRHAREQSLRQASEAALAAEQARAVRAFQAAQEGHWEWNPATRETHLSPRMKQLLGLAADEEPPAGSPPGPLAPGTLHPDDAGPLRAAFLAHEEGRTPSFDFTFRVRRPDSGWRHVRARGNAWRDADGRAPLFSGTAVDLTREVEGREQRRRLEEQLQRALKLEALGTLAGGVAHDFNNILAAVVGYGELARAAAADGSAQARQLDQVLQAGQRGKALVERILSFSRGAPRPHRIFLLQPLVAEVLELLAASLPARLALDTRLNAPHAAIDGDPTLLYEAVTNLCTNGLQAMQEQPGGGRLHVELRSEQLARPLVLSEATLAPGRYACLAVVDEGPGIAPQAMQRLFEPFFTTRGPRRGTGLGLAVVHGVVADLGGAIDVRSMPGQGACFTLYFPLAAEAVDGEAAPPVALPLGQGQSVLVVDDEPALVDLAEELLAGLGYEAFGLASSTQALEHFRQQPERFDLVLTDEAMPEMGGSALATALRRIRPDLPIVLASGYGGPQLEQRATRAGVAVVVGKPLARAELARAVAQALQRRPEALH